MSLTQTLLTTSKITAEAARILGNNLVLAKSVNRDYDNEMGVKGAKIGQTVNVRLPIQPHGRTGPVVDINAVNERYTPLSFTGPYGVDFAFTSTEMTYAIDNFSNRYIAPAAVALANQIELAGYNTLLNGAGNTIGTPGTVMTADQAAQAVLQAAATLYDNGAPIGDGRLTEINSPQFNALLSGANQRLFNPTAEISSVYRRGMIGTYGGADHVVSQLVQRHTNGTFTGTPLVNGAGQTGSSLVTDGWGANSSLNVGDTFTIAGVYSVAPQTYSVRSTLQQFVVTAASVTTGGASTISISPAINVGPGGSQTVSNSPADNAAITVLGASGVSFSQAVMFHRDAIMLASGTLDAPIGSTDSAVMAEPESGLGIRVVRAYDIRNDQNIVRLDSMVAWAMLYPQLAVRIITG